MPFVTRESQQLSYEPGISLFMQNMRVELVVSSFIYVGRRTSYSVFFFCVSADRNRYVLPTGQGAPDATFHVLSDIMADQYMLTALHQAVALTGFKTSGYCIFFYS